MDLKVKPKYYHVTRYRQVRRVRHALVFEWGEGNHYINVSFRGVEAPFDCIHVFNHREARTTVTSYPEFLHEVQQWLRTYDRDSIASAWEEHQRTGK